jgi:outer membrane biosynthesis protein TonB
MESDTIQDSQSLAPQLAEVRAKLDGLLTELRAAEAELATLAPEREQHDLVADACGALEKLRETGGAGLFWGGRDAVAAGEDQLRRARGRADAFGKRVGAIEDRRRTLIEQIRHHEYEAGLIEDDLFEAQEEEELRKLDWIIERELKELPARELVMPWTRRGEDDRRYRKSLAVSLLVCMALAVLFPFIDLPLPDPAEIVELPDRVVRMMIEERPRPPAPAREEIKPPEEQKLAEQPIEKQKPKPVVAEEVLPETVAAAPAEPEPEQGILAFREKLAAFKESRVSDRIGLKPGVASADETVAGRPQRAMLTSNAPGSSGGINLAAYSRNGGGGTGGAGMKGVQVGRATSSIAAIGGGGGDRPLASGGPGLSRTDEEIQIVFDRYKAAFYRLYNRELRKDPTLRGQIVLRLTIEPDGSVSMCMLVSSDMDAPELSAQVVDRVRTINFGAKPEVQALTIVYPIDFLPAA